MGDSLCPKLSGTRMDRPGKGSGWTAASAVATLKIRPISARTDYRAEKQSGAHGASARKYPGIGAKRGAYRGRSLGSSSAAAAVSWIAAKSTVPSAFRDGIRLGVVQPSRTSYLSVPVLQMPAVASRSSRPILPSFSSRLSIIKTRTLQPAASRSQGIVNNDHF